MNTILLDANTWDLVLDANMNIAMATEPYSIAQDAASAITEFVGDNYYNPSQGIPYFSNILGQLPALNYVKQQYIAAAMTVPGVVSAQVFFLSYTNRVLTGQLQVTNNAGVTLAVGF